MSIPTVDERVIQLVIGKVALEQGQIMLIRDCMKRYVISATVDTTLSEAAIRPNRHHIGMLPIIVKENRVVGILGLADIFELLLPDFVRLIDNLDFMIDFGLLEGARIDADIGTRPISEILREPVTIEETAGSQRSYTMMLKHEIHGLPVIGPDGMLVGIASRVDIGTTILSDRGSGTLDPSGRSG